MSDVGWDQEDCQANAKVEIDVNCEDPLAVSLDRIASLKLNQNVSTVMVLLPDIERRFEHRHEKVIASISDLLKTNTNIKNLKVEDANNYKSSPISARVLEMLANGDAGDNLEYLWYDFHELSTSEADILQRYMKTNHNLRRLRIHVGEGPASLQLVSCLSGTKITELCLEVWPYRGMGELGAILGQCSSILSLKLFVHHGEQDFDEVASFLHGASELRSLTRLRMSLHFSHNSAEIVDAIASLVVRQGALAHFDLVVTNTREACIESWQGLAVALCSVKSVSLRISVKEGLLSVLPHLQACESLRLPDLHMGDKFRSSFVDILSNMPNLQEIVVGAIEDTEVAQDAILDLIKASNSIANVRLQGTTPRALRHSIESFCILNRVFGTNLIGFGPTDMWTRILSRVSDDSARATLLYRLLCEKPEFCCRHAVCEVQAPGQTWTRNSDEEHVGAA